MKIEKIKTMAKKMGIKPAGLNKADLIRSIQKAEGNQECFGVRKAADCGQQNCLWRPDCMAL